MPYHIEPTLIIDGTLYILLAFSVLTWTLVLLKSVQFSKNGFFDRRFNKVFWNVTDLKEAQALSPIKAIGPQARLAGKGFNWLDERQTKAALLKFKGPAHDLLEHSLREQLQKEQNDMEQGLTLLASIGSTAPFVGLFGTVLGIMHAMHEITASGSTSLDVVAGPIGDALVATAIGIAVAVPAVLAYNFFLRRAKQHRQALESFIHAFMLVVETAQE